MPPGARAAVCAAMFCLAACGGGANGTISGKVAFSDGSDAAGLRVTLLGAVGKQVETGGGGAYSFEKLPRGVYQVSVEGPDTKEGRHAFGTESDGSTSIAVPDLIFNPLASVTGKVMNSAGPAVGATVYLSGSDRVSLTDGAGSYGFFDVPTGEYALVAKAPGPLPQQASAMVKLKRGKNEALPLTLGNDLTLTGKLEGTVALFNGGSPKDIKVSVADISAMTNENGGFTLTLPPGEYEAVAERAGYPKQSLGFATVRAGQTTTIAVKTLSLYKAFPWPSRISGASWEATSESDIAVLRVLVDTDYQSEYYFLDTKTFTRKLFAIGNVSQLYLSKNGKWAAFVVGSSNGVIAVNSVTGQIHSIAAPGILNGPVISNDESTMMFLTGTPQNQLVRVDLDTGVKTTFPAFLPSYFQSNERFLARTSASLPFDVQLITPTSVSPAFTNLQTFGAYAFAPVGPSYAYAVLWGYNCAATCNVQVLSSTANTASQVAAVIPTTPYILSGTVKDWVALAWGGVTPGRVLVKAADGSATTLHASAYQLLFNETATRVVTYSSGGLGIEVREDSVPPNLNSIVHLTGLNLQGAAWISPTRYIAFSSNPTRRLDLKSGIATTDTDVTLDSTGQSPIVNAPGAMWVRTSTMKRVAVVYDSPELAPETLALDGSYNFTMVGSKSSVINPLLGKFAGFSDGANVFVLDGVKSEARKIGIGVLSSNSSPFIPTDRMKIQRLAGIELQFFESGRVSSLSEPGQIVSPNGAASLPKGGTIAVAIKSSEPKNVLFLTLIP